MQQVFKQDLLTGEQLKPAIKELIDALCLKKFGKHCNVSLRKDSLKNSTSLLYLSSDLGIIIVELVQGEFARKKISSTITNNIDYSEVVTVLRAVLRDNKIEMILSEE